MYNSLQRFLYSGVMWLGVLGFFQTCTGDGMKNSLSSSMREDLSSYNYETSRIYADSALSTTPHLSEFSEEISTSIWISSSAYSELLSVARPTSSPTEETFMPEYYHPEYYLHEYPEGSETPVYSSVEHSVFPTSTTSTSTLLLQNFDVEEPQFSTNVSNTDESSDVKLKTTRALIDSTPYQNVHTPLMSLLVASSSPPFKPETPTSSYESSTPLFSRQPFNNESANTEMSTVPAVYEHKKLLMIVLRAEDCSKLSKLDFEKMLGKLMLKFGFGEVVPQISNAQCHSHLHINLTIGSSAPTLRFFPDMDDKNNVTVDVFNRTFRIVKVEKVDLKIEKSHSHNTSSSVIAKVAKHESVAYIIVGVSFGLVLVICVSVCCIKICCLRKSKKRFVTNSKCSHMRLRPEDYTLTPIPRPTSLYMDYYRGSLTADIYSTTSAGSITSTPTVDQGVVQPFDTSIVPLEDTATLPLDTSRDPSVESAPGQSSMKTFNIHCFNPKGLLNSATDSKENLNPKQVPKRTDFKASGVANPTFQRY